MRKPDRDDHGESRHNDGFSQKLPKQLEPVGPHHLAHAHFPGAHGRPRRGQVHEVDARDERYQQCDNQEEHHVAEITVGLEFAVPVRMQVNVQQGLQRRSQYLGRFAEPA